MLDVEFRLIHCVVIFLMRLAYLWVFQPALLVAGMSIQIFLRVEIDANQVISRKNIDRFIVFTEYPELLQLNKSITFVSSSLSSFFF